MRPNWGRVFRRAIAAAIPLAIIGYVFGRCFLFFHKAYAGGGYDPANEQVLWRTPLAGRAGRALLGNVGEAALAE
jgi:hypothetical protein